jgi:hypothetical protein
LGKCCSLNHCLLPGVCSSVTDLHITLDTSLSATLSSCMSSVTPSITYNKPAASNGPAIFTQSRKLLVVLNRTHSKVCLHYVSHTRTQTGKVRRGELSRRHCGWSEEQTIVIYVSGVRVSKISAVPTFYLSEHKRIFYNCMTN